MIWNDNSNSIYILIHLLFISFVIFSPLSKFYFSFSLVRLFVSSFVCLFVCVQQIHFRFYLGLKKSIVSTWTFRNFKNDQTFKYILRGEVSKSSNYIFAVVFGFKKCIGTGEVVFWTLTNFEYNYDFIKWKKGYETHQ